MAHDVLRGRAHLARYRRLRHPLVSTGTHRPDSWSIPIRSQTGYVKKLLLHLVGVLVQMTSRPLVIVSSPLPVPNLLFQPRPCSSMGAVSGSGPTIDAALSAVGFAEGVAAHDKGHRLLVVHRHSSENLADILGSSKRIRVAIRTFRIDID